MADALPVHEFGMRLAFTQVVDLLGMASAATVEEAAEILDVPQTPWRALIAASNIALAAGRTRVAGLINCFIDIFQRVVVRKTLASGRVHHVVGLSAITRIVKTKVG